MIALWSFRRLFAMASAQQLIGLIKSHAEKSGFPADRITAVSAVIDPTTANPKR